MLEPLACAMKAHIHGRSLQYKPSPSMLSRYLGYTAVSSHPYIFRYLLPARPPYNLYNTQQSHRKHRTNMVGFHMDRYPHPWKLREARSCSTHQLWLACEEINNTIRADRMRSFAPASYLRETQDKCQQVIDERRGSSFISSFPQFDMIGLNDLSLEMGRLGAISGVSPDLLMGQTAPQQSITFQSTPVPQQNITFEPAPAPVPPPPPPPQETIHRVLLKDPFGRVIGSREETEKEKEDREYEAWKKEFGAK
jgi:hypothetical protein